MTEIIRLEPHDPLPDGGNIALVLRRFGEDDPTAVITEIDFFGRHPAVVLALAESGQPLHFEDAIHEAVRQAAQRGIATVYAVDRTAGRREQEVLRHGGDHSVRADELSDTDEEDGERGATILDRPPGAGYVR